MAGVVGIEPTSGVLETLILPLNYTPMYLAKTNDSIKIEDLQVLFLILLKICSIYSIIIVLIVGDVFGFSTVF